MASVGAAAWHDLHGIPAGRELSRLAGRVAARVAEVVQALHHIRAAQGEARAERQRPAVDTGDDADALALKARVDEGGETSDVVAGGARRREDRQDDERRQQPGPAPAGEPRGLGAPGVQIVSTQ